MHKLRTMSLYVALSALSGCGEASDDPPVLTAENQTRWPIDKVAHGPCGTGRFDAVQMPNGGLKQGESVDIELPGPGCYEIVLSIEVFIPCEPKQHGPIETGDLGAGESFTFVFSEDMYVCPEPP